MKLRILGPTAAIGVTLALAAFFLATADRIPCFSNSTNPLAVDCGDLRVEEAFRIGGITHAIDTLAGIYETQPLGSKRDCFHDTGLIGILSYLARSASERENFSFPPETAYCEYGFFYGYLGALFKHNPDPAFMERVCTAVGAPSGETLTNVEGNCYRVAGEVLAWALPLPNADRAGAHERRPDPALADCEAFGTRRSSIDQCVSGVFHHLSVLTSSSGMEREAAKKSLLDLCLAQRPSVRDECFFEIGHQLISLSDSDPISFAKDLAHIEDSALISAAFRTGIGTLAQQLSNLDLQIDLFDHCATLEVDRMQDCTISIVHAIFTNARLNESDVDAGFSFCRYVSRHQPTAEAACYSMFIDEAKKAYTAEEMTAICRKIPPTSGSGCL